ncbi:ATP-binding cassette domain-containing protein [Alteromonas oceanisediminis]|uniref:ATP-binding cassette domain-containing protein n=1 Tax=Alteromonas oceanisediminis TaxID=2836180 RepID=UPI001BDAF33C|nr:ATP-binding cassette domain-containing protein [Alteromonas oceanisediminis]MBT0587872.1 ATP-binding cassette domain-containing protein [Alteromonas oceanisediminis]
MIKITDVSLMRGTKMLLDTVSAEISPKQKVALIGANGCGKSSLFALLRGELTVESGELYLPKQWQIVSVAQEVAMSAKPALEYVIDGDKHLRAIQHALREAEGMALVDGKRIAELHAKLEEAGAYTIDARASTILAGLGFSQEQLTQPVSAFSGGWQMRLNLAQALLCPSDLLLLDEPTNHLDLDAVIWLEKWIQRYEGTLLLISHDKAFIDSSVDRILSVEQQQLYTYTGNYSAYEKQKAERQRLQNLEYQKQQEKRQHLQSFIDRFKAKASKAKQAQSRIKQLERMETLVLAHADSPFSFAFDAPDKLPNPLVSMENVTVGYDTTVVLDQVKLNLVPGSRIGLLGRNGAGKSTLIKLLAGEKKPMSGRYDISAGLNVGYFAQHQLEYLDLEASALTHLQRLDPRATEQSLRDFLGGFNFQGDSALKPVAPFSGGEKARLVLAMIVYQRPNILLLDEPTNHLDLDMRQALNLALQGFEGAMILVSHDRYLLTSVCEDFYLVDSGAVAPFNGDLEDYRQWLLDSEKQAEQSGVDPVKPTLDRKVIKRLEAEFRQKTSEVRMSIAKAEKGMESASNRLSALQEKLADMDLYTEERKAELKDLLNQQKESEQLLSQHESSWMEAQEALEVMQSEFEHTVSGNR